MDYSGKKEGREQERRRVNRGDESNESRQLNERKRLQKRESNLANEENSALRNQTENKTPKLKRPKEES